MALDLTQSAWAILLEQINADNGTTLTVDQVSFGAVMVNTGPDWRTYNSAIRITGVRSRGFSGTRVYKYNRIQLCTLFAASNSSFNVDSCHTYADLIALVNAAAKTNCIVSVRADGETNQQAVPGDILPSYLPEPTQATPSVQFVLSADPKSPIYVGEAMLNATTSTTDLSSVITRASSGLAAG